MMEGEGLQWESRSKRMLPVYVSACGEGEKPSAAPGEFVERVRDKDER